MSNALLLRTAARWKIPRELALEVLARDVNCIYCRCTLDLTGPRGGVHSWEHIVNDLAFVHPANIALCCVSCNASKGRKTLDAWLQSSYCRDRGITGTSMAPVAIDALRVSRLQL